MSGRSILRLATVVILVTAAVLLGRMTHPGRHPVAATPAPHPTVSVATASPSATQPVPVPVPAPTPSRATVRPHLSPSTVANRFVAAWLRVKGGKRAWLTGMRPWAAPDYLDALATTDPGNVWRAKVSGTAKIVEAPTGGRALVQVPTSSGTLAVSLGTVDGYWVVSSLDVARS